MKKNLHLDEYEADLVESIEKDEWVETGDIDNERKRLKNIAIRTQQKSKEIKIKVNENEYFLLKKKELETGISYESIIKALIHSYNCGKINLIL